MNFSTGKELLDLATANGLPLSQVMLLREIENTEVSKEGIYARLTTALEIMKNAAHSSIQTPRKSVGGLIGGEAHALSHHNQSRATLCGPTLSKALAYAIGVLEVNATMGLIVATPTAGSSGVLPGTLLSLQEEKNLDDNTLYSGLLNASAIGYLIMRNASVSGAEAGCQAEVGSASAMAASAIVELLGGTPQMCFTAATIALSNLLGLVCDPIAGLVEVPCQTRNAIGVSNAFTCAQLALSGITYPIPFDEMVHSMHEVGQKLPLDLRETALGGNASTPTGCELCKKITANKSQ